MFRYVALLATLLLAPLAADRIADVEYNLPKTKYKWKQVGEQESDKGKTIYYSPDVEANENANSKTYESFAVHCNNLPSGPTDAASLKEIIAAQFGGEDVEVSLLKSEPSSVTYEFSVGREENGVRALVKSFGSEKGTVMLMYTTNELSSLEKNRDPVIQALFEASKK